MRPIQIFCKLREMLYGNVSKYEKDEIRFVDFTTHFKGYTWNVLSIFFRENYLINAKTQFS